MAKYHLNPTTGNPGECSAAEGNCPYGTDAPHYGSPEEARAAFESQQEVFGTVKKAPSASEYFPRDPQEPHNIYGTQSRAIAQRATAHNEGQTVYAQKLGLDGTVSLKMSSWPRANEAKRALEKEGYLVEMGDNNMGQWIHVSPKPHDDFILDTSELAWNGASKQFEIDQTTDNYFPKAIYSPKFQETLALGDAVEDRDPTTNEVVGWRISPKFHEVDWCVYLKRRH